MSVPASISEFMTGLTHAFRDGDMDTATAPFAAPATLQIAGQRLYVKDRTQAAAMLAIYRENLRVEAFSHTEVELHHQETTPDGDIRILATFTQRNASGAKISRFDTCFFLTPVADDASWTIGLIEIITKPIPRLIAGLPIH